MQSTVAVIKKNTNNVLVFQIASNMEDVKQLILQYIIEEEYDEDIFDILIEIVIFFHVLFFTIMSL